MKKIMLTAVALIAMVTFTFGQSKEYLDAKKIIDAYEQNVNKATSCEELENASLDFFIQLLGLIDVEYTESEEMTEKEEKLINEQTDRISAKLESLQKQWNCQTEEDEEDAEEEKELIPTSTKEWDEILDSYDAVTKKVEKLKNIDLEDEADLSKLLEVLTEAEPIVTRIDSADTSNMTEKQSKRLDAINDRFYNAAKAIGLIDEDE